MARTSRDDSKAPQQKRHVPLRPRTLGPVDDLERHVPNDWWRYIFNPLYLKTDADVVNDPTITAQEIDYIISVLNLRPSDHILDLCCGQGRHTLELARRGFHLVEGLDRSHYLIQRAKATAKKEGLHLRFREGDARKLPYKPDTFDVVLLLGNSFGYFETLQDDLMVLREIFRVLKPWGRLLIDVADGDYLRQNFERRSWEWIDRNYFVCRERSLSLDGERIITREVITHVKKGVIADQFYAERLYNRELLQTLLTEAGFSDIVFHGTITTPSQRNQDLGMMARRLIVTAVVRKAWTRIPISRKPSTRTVAVILGDPRKPDPLKPGGCFDDDDIYTVDKLKDALHRLSGYRFIYLDDHDSMIEQLTRLKGKIDFVLNLCDEGFGNDPAKELHVPALLEILGIPYTGASPQCLAYCYDKSLVRGVAKEMGIPVPDAIFIRPDDSVFHIPMNFPVIVKPNFGDSSFGITARSVCSTIEELWTAIEEIRTKFGYEKPILVEEFLTGKDLTVGIIGNPPDDYMVLPIAEEDYSVLPPNLPPICGYEAKWLPDSPYWNLKSIPANLPEDTEKAIVEYCLQLFRRLGCRDYARFDWRLDASGQPRLLEVNPNPGWCWDGHLAKMAALQGMSYAEMLLAILQAAERRLGLEPLYSTSQNNFSTPQKQLI